MSDRVLGDTSGRLFILTMEGEPLVVVWKDGKCRTEVAYDPSSVTARYSDLTEVGDSTPNYPDALKAMRDELSLATDTLERHFRGE